MLFKQICCYVDAWSFSNEIIRIVVPANKW